MNSFVLIIGMLLGQMQVTSYQSIRSQTDGSPNFTSIGDRTHRGGVAVSQDLLCPVGKHCTRNVSMFCKPEKLHYRDYIYIQGLGIFEVNDCMNKRYKNRLDVWVASQAEEKAFHSKYKNKSFSVYLLKTFK